MLIDMFGPMPTVGMSFLVHSLSLLTLGLYGLLSVQLRFIYCSDSFSVLYIVKFITFLRLYGQQYLVFNDAVYANVKLEIAS